MKLSRREFCQTTAIVLAALAGTNGADYSNESIKPNAQAFSDGKVIANIYGFNYEDNVIDKLEFLETPNIDSTMHIIYSEYVIDDDGVEICMSSSIRNVLITGFKKKLDNVFFTVSYVSGFESQARLDYPLVDRKVVRGINVSRYRVPNSPIVYTV